MKIRAHIIALLGILSVSTFVIPEYVEGQATVKRDTKKAKQLREQADKAYRQKNYREAVDKYAQSIPFDQTNADAHFWKGFAHYHLKEFDQSVSDLNKALELGYKPVEVYRIRAYAHDQRKDLTAASADIREVLKSTPNDPVFLQFSAEVNYQLKNYDEALASYQRLSAKAPVNGNLHYFMSRIYAAMGNLQGQENSAKLAIQNGTSFLSEAHVFVGDAQQKNGRLQDAEASYLKALQSKQDNLPVYHTLADIYRSQSRYNDAIEIMRRGLRLYPNDGGLYTDISWYYSLAGRHEEAIQAAQAGIRYLPGEYMAYTNLCRAYNDVNKPDLAIAACNNALKISPEDGETFFYLGRAHDLLNKPAEATKYYKRAVTGLINFTQTRPDYSDGFYLLGNAYFADNQPEKAIEAYQKCLQMSPRFARARYNLAMVQLQMKNKMAASEQYNILIGIDQTLATKLKTEIDKLP
jgi:tetratricopeptide (TPR) repeat protein